MAGRRERASAWRMRAHGAAESQEHRGGIFWGCGGLRAIAIAIAIAIIMASMYVFILVKTIVPTLDRSSNLRRQSTTPLQRCPHRAQLVASFAPLQDMADSSSDECDATFVGEVRAAYVL